MDFIYSQVERILDKHGSRDPFVLLKGLGAVLVYSNEYGRGGLMGYSTILNRIMYAVINEKLPDAEKRIVAGHEAGHLVLHQDIILSSPIKAMQDFRLYDSSSRYEREANLFLADFLLGDDSVMDVITQDGINYIEAASALYVPPPLLAFKLFSMSKRDFKGLNYFDLDSRFLAKRDFDGEGYSNR
ncbi:MAG: ImmA/IrrE family metallo-endopeptidase [Clostridiales bacterium]|jgi:Zn-dependent peptidase ImmA (M78 family)|nr:ImmA/IrrE family metallo-endopeptidase [Clostridiales bacterium]